MLYQLSYGIFPPICVRFVTFAPAIEAAKVDKARIHAKNIGKKLGESSDFSGHAPGGHCLF